MAQIIAHSAGETLDLLDAGAVSDEFQVFKWDGIRGFSDHNRDQDVRSAMRVSAVWVYE
jgi:beta-lactamase class D OXA-2